MSINTFTIVQEFISIKLESLFKGSKGKNSAFFIDPSLQYVISKIIPPYILGDCFKKIYTYESNKTKFDFDIITILTTGKTFDLSQHATNIGNCENKPKEILLIFTNKSNYLSKQCLEINGLLHLVTIVDLELPFWYIDYNLCSLEISNSFLNNLIYNSKDLIQEISDSITTLKFYEYSPNFYLIGDNSNELLLSLPQKFLTSWSDIIIFDRSVDLITPFLTSFNYEGVISENVEITLGITKVKINNQENFVDLTSNDPISNLLRDLPYHDAINQLHNRSKFIKNEFERMKDKVIISERTELLKDLGEKVLENKSFADHLQLATNIHEYLSKEHYFKNIIDIELNYLLGLEKSKDFILNPLLFTDDFKVPIQLLTLYSLINSSKNLEKISEVIIDKFGLISLVTLWSLFECGIIPNTKNINYLNLFYKLNLFDENKNNISIPYSGYIPLITKIIQKIIENNWENLKFDLNNLKIKTNDVIVNSKSSKNKILIIFIGGSMYGEISSIRILKKLYSNNIDILTTEMLSRSKLIDQLSGK